MNRKTAWIILAAAGVVIAACVAVMVAFPGTDWSHLDEPEAIRAAAGPEGAYSGLVYVRDRTSAIRPGRNVAIEVSCPAGTAAMECGAAASRALAIWLSAHGQQWNGSSGEAGEVAWLIVNVTFPGLGASSGYQLIGDIQPVAGLEGATIPDILARFQWNGASDLGDVPAAEWCAARRDDPAFCQAFRAEACPGAVIKERATEAYCRRWTD